MFDVFVVVSVSLDEVLLVSVVGNFSRLVEVFVSMVRFFVFFVSYGLVLEGCFNSYINFFVFVCVELSLRSMDESDIV